MSNFDINTFSSTSYQNIKSFHYLLSPTISDKTKQAGLKSDSHLPKCQHADMNWGELKVNIF